MIDATQGFVLGSIILALIASTGFAAHVISQNGRVQQRLTQSSAVNLTPVLIEWPESCSVQGMLMCSMPQGNVESTLSEYKRVCLSLRGNWSVTTASCTVNGNQVF